MELLIYISAIVVSTLVCLLYLFHVTEKDRDFMSRRRNAITRDQEEFSIKTK